MKDPPQINGYLSQSERKDFGDYAGQFGLDASALATLLFHRELRVARLGRLETLYDRTSYASRGRKITIRVTDAAKLKFGDHVECFGLDLPIALLLLCRAEMAEKWLEACVDC